MLALLSLLPAVLPALLLAASPAAAGGLQPLSPAREERVDALLGEMTLEEKIGQLRLLSATFTADGSEAGEELKAAVRQGRAGAVFNAFGPVTEELQRLSRKESRLGIPLLFAFDVLHGHRTVFPIPLALAASFDPGLVERTARRAAREAAAEGIHWTFAPMLDVSRDPRWGRIAEGPGEDPLLAARLAAAAVRGYQAADLAAPGSLIATPKHMGAYGAPVAGREYNSADISERSLREIHLPAFAAAIEAGAAALMPAFNDLAGLPATASRPLLRDMLRNEWGFSGVVVSDFEAIPELRAHGVAGTLMDAAELALAAGVDLDMQGKAYDRPLLEAVRDGRVAETLIDEAVRRVLELKARKGLLDARPPPAPPAPKDDARALAREAARRSIVLLKNDGDLLPLAPRGQRIAVIGPLCDAPREMLGPWAGAGDPAAAVSYLAGLREAAGGALEIRHLRGSSVERRQPLLLKQAVEGARAADLVLLCLGEHARMSGEAASRAEPVLPAPQIELARAVLATGTPAILLLTAGRPLVLGDLAQEVPAILLAWFLGHEAGNAVADILLGAAAPSARLPVSIPRSTGQIPIFHAQRPTGRPSSESHYTSRYLDMSFEPQWPFGHGLAYTRFRYGPLRLDREEIGPGESLVVELRVENAGARAGEELVQLYLRDPVASVARPVRELKDFRRVRLEPGQGRLVRFELSAAAMRFLGQDMKPRLEPGRMRVIVGPDAAHGRAAGFTLRGPPAPRRRVRLAGRRWYA
ncbi:glycoside hydrolase family 3 N-terminal domain-containing protein [Geminicoccaceae bacterium 1502E]|nr:glycoside hydrolase family 3 N-terminal domain-containing protein [Geminicoccaceae bacterium 1502E]